MKLLGKVLLALLGLVFLLVVIALFLPTSAHVERRIVIKATPDTVFTTLNSFQRFNEWSPWAALDPATRYRYEGPQTGVGAKMSWESDDPAVGKGSQEILESVAPTLIRTRLAFEGQGDARAEFRLTSVAEGTEVVWAFETDFGYDPIGRWFGLLMFDSLIGSDYEKGLNQLKALQEK